MRNMKKRFFLPVLSVLLALTLMVTAIPAAFAAGGTVAVTPTTGGTVQTAALHISADGNTKDTVQLSATRTGDSEGTFTWSSDATGVASVDTTNGLVTAVSAGSATITATCSGGEEGKIQITVTQDKEKAGVKILTESNADAQSVAFTSAGQRIKLNSEITPAALRGTGTYLWTAGNGVSVLGANNRPSVVIESGSSVAANGTITLTYTPPATSNYTEGSDSANATVTISTTPTTVAISPTGYAFTKIGETKSFTATATPNVAGEHLWSIVGSGLSIDSGANTATAVVKSTAVTTGAKIRVQFTPTASTHSGNTAEINATVTETTPAIGLTVDGGTSKTFVSTSSSVSASTAVALTNMNADEWDYTWHKEGDTDAVALTTSGRTCVISPKKNGTCTVYIKATLKTNTATTVSSNKITLKVDTPEPRLVVSTNHDTLSSSRTKTTVYVELKNATSDVPDNSKVYWTSSNTKVARVAESSERLDDGKASVTVNARGNGKTIITAKTNNGHVIDSIEIEVKDYKAIPQAGQDTRMIYAEAAVLAAMLITAGVLYARNRRKKHEN